MTFRGVLNLRLAIIAVWVLAIVLAVLIIGPGNIVNAYRTVTPQGIRHFVLSFGALSMVIYIFMHVIRPFTFLPATPFTIAGGFIFGNFYGLLFSVIGTMLSAVLTFFLSRYLFREQVKRWLKGRYDGIDKSLEGNGMYMIAVFRLIPVVPFDAVGYVAGVSSIKFRDYMIGSLIGELPGAFVLTMLGSSLKHIGSPVFYASIVLLLLLIALPEAYKRIVSSRAGKYRK